MSNKGWVKFHREQFGHWVSKNKEPFCDGYAWCYLYANANHKKGIVNFRNEYIEVERGQLLRSKLQLQENFKWTRRHVENFLLALKNDEMITYRMTNRYTVITILNYEKYQGKEDNDDIQNTSQVTNRKQTESKQIANDPLHTRIIKNVKNDNNVKNEIHTVVLDHWNSKGIVKTKDLSDKLSKQIDIALKAYGKDKILQAIDHYAIMLADATCKFVDYKWSLEVFLKQYNCLPYFLDDGIRWINYKPKVNDDWRKS